MKTFIDVFCGIPYLQLFPLCKKVGFDGFFSGEVYANDPIKLNEIVALARKNELEWETSHSTIPQSQTIWSQGDDGDRYCNVLLSNIDNCKRIGVPLLVVHIAPDFSKEPSFELGIQRLEPVVKYAKKAGVKIAFENINSEEYLVDTLTRFNHSHVGFCYDCGHEACHTPGARYLPRLANMLPHIVNCHLHDNDGKGDCHWLPFDGIIDFERISHELKKCNYQGNLTLELCYSDDYEKKYAKEAFIQEAYFRVNKLQAMIKGE